MKLIKTVLLLAVVALATGLGACSKNDNPAEKFAGEIEKITKEVNSIKTQEGFQDLQSGLLAADQIAKDNADYVLTDADKETIKKAMGDFFRSVFKKGMELEGHEVSDAQIDMMVNMATASVDRASTLGELSSPAQGATETVVEEATVIEEPADSDAVASEETEVLD